tara:strand:+ start:861 stop:1859 length:999 start_codon:yes stop_codon:yes gene_type:complete
MDFLALPKIDLHCHLDGSVRPDTIIDLAKQYNIELPEDRDAVVQSLTVPEDCKNLDEYLACFSLPLKVMQTEEAIERISFELYEDAALENVKYLEVRFAPILHVNKGLSLDAIIASAVKGMKRAEEKYDIKGNYIMSVLRMFPKDSIKDVIDAGKPYLGKGVVAFDIAGGEKPGFCAEFPEYTQYAIEQGYRVTVHAGEQWHGQNVYDAVAMLDAERIGHGVHIQGNEDAYNIVKEKQVALETCPTSNVQTKCIHKFSDHPISEFKKDGIIVTINTDNRTVSNTTMTNEVKRVCETFDLTKEDYAEIYKYSVESAFASDEVKQHLMGFVEQI